MVENLEESVVLTNGIRLHLVQAGPRDGPPVILLHGFPEPWFTWQKQVGPLAAAGYRVLAPDQRGYNTSDRPDSVSAYALDTLAADVLGLIEANGWAKVRLVGHDWGGVVAWWVATRYPERLEQLVILNAPHPVGFRRFLRSHPRQLLRSWYTFYFQIPRLPEALFRWGNWRLLSRALRRSSRSGTFTEADLDRYRIAWSQPGAIKAMIHWYRAAMRFRPVIPVDLQVRVPTLIIWGKQDRFLDSELARSSAAFCEQGRLEFLETATHWVQHEEPERVNQLLLDFLATSRITDFGLS